MRKAIGLNTDYERGSSQEKVYLNSEVEFSVVLEHNFEPGKILSEGQRILKPEGIFLLKWLTAFLTSLS